MTKLHNCSFTIFLFLSIATVIKLSVIKMLLEVNRFPELKAVLIHKPDNYT